MPAARLDGCLQWVHLSSGHTACNRSIDVPRECFYSLLTFVNYGRECSRQWTFVTVMPRDRATLVTGD